MYKEGIQSSLKQGTFPNVIARKIYLSFPTSAFVGKEEVEFNILNDVRDFFDVPFSSIKVVGSSKTGYSHIKNRDFMVGASDLDVAIIDPSLFQRHCELVLSETKGFTDLSNFERHNDGTSKYKTYCKYLARGIFRPDLMPIGPTSKAWFNFFNKLSDYHLDLFSDINAGIYFSEFCFEVKQADTIEYYKSI